jgi:hypothetical protein
MLPAKNRAAHHRTHWQEYPMAIYRMFTGDDDHTHIEETPLAEHPNLMKLESTKGVYIRTRPDETMETHPAPELRWLVVLSGIMEVTPANSNDSVRFGAGDIVRITDVTGSGHATSFINDCTFAIMPINA